MRINSNLLLLFAFLSIQIVLGQELSESELIGKWEFINLQDEKGNVLVEIPIRVLGKESIEKVNRDNYIFNSNMSYKSYNPLNVSNGTWFFDKEKEEINLELIISPDNPAWEYLKKIVEKRKDGKYYQKPVKKRILFFEKDSMVIADRLNYVLIYKRKHL
ncbi:MULTISPECIES: hypothetical protein [Flavobacteriaceae]|uniref:hypothetical protein n=1 Tax=Flavobacteriaceae TaxID=49546 RepID=UPI0014910DAE|nr:MULTISPECIES: hypothetical protein [Allomuricauda]MDC6367183.1 hypothetical protein [Muricauda sp. AC10]